MLLRTLLQIEFVLLGGPLSLTYGFSLNRPLNPLKKDIKKEGEKITQETSH